VSPSTRRAEACLASGVTRWSPSTERAKPPGVRCHPGVALDRAGRSLPGVGRCPVTSGHSPLAWARGLRSGRGRLLCPGACASGPAGRGSFTSRAASVTSFRPRAPKRPRPSRGTAAGRDLDAPPPSVGAEAHLGSVPPASNPLATPLGTRPPLRAEARRSCRAPSRCQPADLGGAGPYRLGPKPVTGGGSLHRALGRPSIAVSRRQRHRSAPGARSRPLGSVCRPGLPGPPPAAGRSSQPVSAGGSQTIGPRLGVRAPRRRPAARQARARWSPRYAGLRTSVVASVAVTGPKPAGRLLCHRRARWHAPRIRPSGPAIPRGEWTWRPDHPWRRSARLGTSSIPVARAEARSSRRRGCRTRRQRSRLYLGPVPRAETRRLDLGVPREHQLASLGRASCESCGPKPAGLTGCDAEPPGGVLVWPFAFLTMPKRSERRRPPVGHQLADLVRLTGGLRTRRTASGRVGVEPVDDGPVSPSCCASPKRGGASRAAPPRPAPRRSVARCAVDGRLTSSRFPGGSARRPPAEAGGVPEPGLPTLGRLPVPLLTRLRTRGAVLRSQRSWGPVRRPRRRPHSRSAGRSLLPVRSSHCRALGRWDGVVAACRAAPKCGAFRRPTVSPVGVPRRSPRAAVGRAEARSTPAMRKAARPGGRVRAVSGPGATAPKRGGGPSTADSVSPGPRPVVGAATHRPEGRCVSGAACRHRARPGPEGPGLARRRLGATPPIPRVRRPVRPARAGRAAALSCAGGAGV
jgi:hypothetical protein